MAVCSGLGEKGMRKSLPVVKTNIDFPAYELISVIPVLANVLFFMSSWLLSHDFL